MIDSPSLSPPLGPLARTVWRHVAVAIKRLQHAPPMTITITTMMAMMIMMMARTGDKLDLNSLPIACLSTRQTLKKIIIIILRVGAAKKKHTQGKRSEENRGNNEEIATLVGHLTFMARAEDTCVPPKKHLKPLKTT